MFDAVIFFYCSYNPKELKKHVTLQNQHISNHPNFEIDTV